LKFLVAGIVLILAALAVASCSSSGAATPATAPARTAAASPGAAASAVAAQPSAAASPSAPPEATAPASEPSTAPAQPTKPPVSQPAATSTPVPPPPPPPPPPPAAQSIIVKARDLQFSPRSVTAKAGVPVTITMANQDVGVRHDISIFAPDGGSVAATDTVAGPASAATTFTPSAGTYPFKCSVHFSMTGTLVVQ